MYIGIGTGGEMLTLLMLLVACDRPTDEYPVRLHGAGTQLEDIQSAPSAMSGRVEVVRFRLWGSNLGYGLTGVFGDSPRADGMGFVMGAAHFGYPAVTAYDRPGLPSAPDQRPPIPAWSEAPHPMPGPWSTWMSATGCVSRVLWPPTSASSEIRPPIRGPRVRAGMWATGTSSCRMFRGIRISRTHGHRAPRGR